MWADNVGEQVCKRQSSLICEVIEVSGQSGKIM